VAAGYKRANEVADEISIVRAATDRPFGVNLFVPSRPPVDDAALAAYVERLAAEEERYGVRCGEPRWSDDDWDAKLALVARERPAVVSFTFGCPEPETVDSFRSGGIETWCTVTSAREAEAAAAAGIDALVVQGAEAGGHQSSWDDTDDAPLGLLALLQVVRRASDRPLIAAGGIATGAAVRAVLAAGAVAAQIGSALLLAPEAGTIKAHRTALAADHPTALTRAFSGRRARGIVNRFMREHDAAAPSAYPEVHNLTAPVRAAARAAGDADGFHLWAGQAHALAPETPAGELVRRLAADAAAALEDAAGRIGRPDGG
jgi:nitronate monooxygenase